MVDGAMDGEETIPTGRGTDVIVRDVGVGAGQTSPGRWDGAAAVFQGPRGVSKALLGA